jgi:RNA polymerase sigma-70 factor (ECF subfamily)
MNDYRERLDDLVKDNIAWMLKLATSILRDPQDAQDAVQNAFEQAFKGIDQFDGRSTIKTWLHRITVNASLMNLRSENKHEAISIETLMPTFDEYGCRVGDDLGKLTSVEKIVSNERACQGVFDAVNQLPDEYRIVLLLRDVEGYSTAEVADCMEISVTNAKVRLHRGRAALKKLLEPLLFEEKS